jgi:hypothetical protein
LLAVVGNDGGASSGGDDVRDDDDDGGSAHSGASAAVSRSPSHTASSAEAAHCRAVGIHPGLLVRAPARGGLGEGAPTPTYAALLDGRGDLVAVRPRGAGEQTRRVGTVVYIDHQATQFFIYNCY